MAKNAQHVYPGRPGGPGDSADERWQRMWSHREHLLRVARRRSMSVEDAEDAVHEAMVRAVENPNIDDERLAAWLTTVTMRLCFDRYRQLNREAEVSSRSAMAAPAPVPVDEVVCDRAEAKWLARRSESLPARQAEALQLKSEDLDVAEVATQMGLSYEAAESLLARARRAMRNSLASTLALAAWLGRGRFESLGPQAAVAAVATSAATLAVLGIPLPHTDDGGRPSGPEVSRVEKGDEPSGEGVGEEPAPASRSTLRPESGPTRTPAPEKPLPDVTSLVPGLSTPVVPDVTAVVTVPSEPPGLRLPTAVPTSPEPAEPTETGLPRIELPGGGSLSVDVGDPRD